jgi:hypothetical protein
MLTFTSSFNLNRSIELFDSLYEEELQLDHDDKSELLEVCRGQIAYLFLNGKVVGETYGASPAWLFQMLDDDIPDTNRSGNSCYCYSTTIVPAYQGFGFGKILKAYWLGLCRAKGFVRVCGHATSEGAIKLNKGFGAVFVGHPHLNWEGTTRTAHYYEIDL